MPSSRDEYVMLAGAALAEERARARLAGRLGRPRLLVPLPRAASCTPRALSVQSYRAETLTLSRLLALNRRSTYFCFTLSMYVSNVQYFSMLLLPIC